MKLSVVVRAREDGTDTEEVLRLATKADELGYPELWIGEGPTWDAFVLATAVGLNTQRSTVTVGPVPVSVRDPATISRGAASVASVIGRPVGVALGTSSVRVVEKLHRRSRQRSLGDLEDRARAIRTLMETPPGQRHSGDPDARFLRRLSAPDGPLTVAAFGNRAIQVAATYADRMLLDLVSPEQVTRLRERLEEVAGPRRPTLAAWLPVAVDPTPQARREARLAIAGYLTVAGYREMFISAGFEKAVAAARSGPDPRELESALPEGAEMVVGLVGSDPEIRRRFHDYASAGLDEIAIVPVTAGDPGAERTLSVLSSFG